MPGTSIERASADLSTGTLVRLAESGTIITGDGESLPMFEAESADLVAWSVFTQRMRATLRLLEDTIAAELAIRIRAAGGPITTDNGTASESISRGSVSGIQAKHIRALLEDAAADGEIPWDAVDNVAPLVAHVTPAKAAQYAEDAPAHIGEKIAAMLPERRRSVKVEGL